MSGAPARGTAPRIPRRHHHHHHHHQNNNPPSQDRRRKPDDKSITHEESRPKVNPIFLWALQREQRIIEVRCEDYDKRNRIKLTKTAQGWRSIPRTASNVYTTSLTASRNLNNNCESPAALSSAASSPASSRWSPTTISSSTNPAWSVSSTRSLAISSPTAEDEEMPSRNHSEEESTNDFDDTRKNSRKKRRRERRSESEKRRKGGSLSVVNSDVVTDEDSINDVDDNSSIYARKKRRRMKKSREYSRTPLASSPRSWELLMNGTRFLNRGPTADRREDDKEDYEVNVTKIQNGHFNSIDLERAKKDQHLQPRVVLEQLHLSRPSNTIETTDETEVEKHQQEETEGHIEEQEEREVEEEQDEQEDEEDDQIEEEVVESKEKPIPDKPEIRDILSMLDSTGSPVLATDTPSAHLPSSHDSTKTNISSCYENRDYQKSSRQSTTCRDESEQEKINERTLQNSYKSNTKVTKTISQDSRSYASSNMTKVNNRKDNANTELCSNELGSSSEILEALRSTPGLSVSVTTRLPAETRLEIPESTATTRIATKRPSSSALYLDRLLPRTPTIAGTPCCSSPEVTCSEDARNELTLKGILATPSRGHVSGPGLAAVVNRLANRRNDLLRPEARSQNESSNRVNRKPSSSSSGSSLGIESGNNIPKRPRITEAVRSRAEPAKQLRELVVSSGDSIPDPLLVPRDRLPALAAAPATEIPKLLASRPELRLPEALTRPELLRDPDLLVISLAHLQHVLDNGDGPFSDYKYKPPHPLAMPVVDPEDEDVDEEDELVEEEDDDDEEEEEEEEEDQDVPEQSLDLLRNAVAVNGVRGNIRGSVEDNSMRIQRVPPKLISCKPIGTLMPGPIDLSRNCIRSIIPSRTNQNMVASIPGIRQQDATLAQLPPPPLVRVRTGLLKQESEVTSTEVSNNPCVQDDSHLWHPLFGSQKRQRQVQAQQQQQQQQQQQHRNSWHRTTLAS